MSMEKLLDKVHFDKILPGDYDYEVPEILPSPPSRTSRIWGGTTKRTRLAFPDHSVTKNLAPETHELYRSSLHEVEGEASGVEDQLFMAAAGAAVPVVPEKETKTEDIHALEQILSSAYHEPVAITKIRALPLGRKEVREVIFVKGNALSKVWVFKADPETTAKELMIYHLAHSVGVPTGKPVGIPSFSSPPSYPFDVVILGGIVENAGEPYTTLLENMELRPDVMFKTAVGVSSLIALYQTKLTAAGEKFAERGIDIPQTSPRKELNNRLLATLRVEESEAEELLRTAEILYHRQRGPLVISHGDIHLGNIVTSTTRDKRTGQLMTSIQDFGVIDWGSITRDYPQGDVEDFWVHHLRQTRSICPDYGFHSVDLHRHHQASLAYLAKKSQISLLPHDCERNAYIQSVLWHIYELYDPTRKNEEDRSKKLAFHARELLTILHDAPSDLVDDVAALKSNLYRLVSQKDPSFARHFLS